MALSLHLAFLHLCILTSSAALLIAVPILVTGGCDISDDETFILGLLNVSNALLMYIGWIMPGREVDS